MTKQLKIIYPPLVEDAYTHYKQSNAQLTKQEVFKWLLEEGLVNVSGYPTDKAIELGFVREFTEEVDMDYSTLMEIYPVFERYDAQHFHKIDGFWEVDEYLARQIEWDMDHAMFTQDELMELEAFFEPDESDYYD